MKNMGQLWLKAEVRDLESRVRRKAGNFSPYLVVDSEALIEHIVLVKQLVGSRQFIVIIPTVGKLFNKKFFIFFIFTLIYIGIKKIKHFKNKMFYHLIYINIDYSFVSFG